MNISTLRGVVSRNKLSMSAFVIGAFVASTGIVALAQQTPASAAETNVGQQVITINGTKTTTQFNVCKISQGGGTYKVRVRASHSSALLLANGGYRLNVGSNLGSSTSASAYVNSRLPVTSVVSNGKAGTAIRFNTFLGYKTSAGYSVTPGTTLRSFTVGSIPTC